MFSVKYLVERLRLFERNNVPLGLKVLGLALNIRYQKEFDEKQQLLLGITLKNLSISGLHHMKKEIASYNYIFKNNHPAVNKRGVPDVPLERSTYTV
ncbi:MAG: hypothetical protein ACPLYF_05130 [Fervidobacterium sp.]